MKIHKLRTKKFYNIWPSMRCVDYKIPCFCISLVSDEGIFEFWPDLFNHGAISRAYDEQRVLDDGKVG